MQIIDESGGQFVVKLHADGVLVVQRTRDGRIVSAVPLDPSVPGPPPEPKSPAGAEITVGDWSANFLYGGFFGPAVVARPSDERLAYFQDQRQRGYRHVLINPDQADWGPSKGHPEWTSGGFDMFASPAALTHTVGVCLEALQTGLTPVVSLIDQPRLKREPLDQILDRCRAVVPVLAPYTCMFMLSWEINEVWGNGDEREPNLRRWIAEVDWHGRDVGIHFAGALPYLVGPGTDHPDEEDGGLSGGLRFYGEMPPNVVRLMQYSVSAPDHVLREQSRLIAAVARQTDTKVCAFEHSSEVNNTPSSGREWSHEESRHRAAVCLEAFRDEGLRPDQCGSLNG